MDRADERGAAHEPPIPTPIRRHHILGRLDVLILTNMSVTLSVLAGIYARMTYAIHNQCQWKADGPQTSGQDQDNGMIAIGRRRTASMTNVRESASSV